PPRPSSSPTTPTLPAKGPARTRTFAPFSVADPAAGTTARSPLASGGACEGPAGGPLNDADAADGVGVWLLDAVAAGAGGGGFGPGGGCLAKRVSSEGLRGGPAGL